MANKALTPPQIDAIRAEIEAGTPYSQIHKKLGVSMGTISNVGTGLVSAELDQRKAAKARAERERAYKEALEEIDRLRKELGLAKGLERAVAGMKPAAVKVRHGGRGEAVAVTCWNDWHYEEVVSKSAVNGVNEYSPSVAKERLKKLLVSTVSIIEMCRSKSRIDTVVVGILGDLISGYIHDELVATNEMPPTQAILDVFEMVTGGLETLRREIKPKEILVPCVCGNHGRWTDRAWAKMRAETSFEGLLYGFLAKWYAERGDKVIRIIPPQGEMTYLTVYGRTLRFMHGDSIRYAGGIGGVHIPLRKALDAWNTQRAADYNYLGHWHNDITGEDYRISGSMIGVSEYSLRIKARYQAPSQAFELIHPKYGSTARFPIVLAAKAS